MTNANKPKTRVERLNWSKFPSCEASEGKRWVQYADAIEANRQDIAEARKEEREAMLAELSGLLLVGCNATTLLDAIFEWPNKREKEQANG